jgi:Ca-activated chloride channel family protein
LRLRFSRPVSDLPDPDPPPAQIVQALSRLMLYRMQEKAREEINNGRIENATRHLQALASNLLTQGERSLAQTILLEVDHLKRRNVLSSEGSKKLNYGTRALVNAPPKKE